MSIVFDRAVDYYDRTRAMPPDVANLAIEALIRESNLQPGARVLEIGIGTGRIALPLAARTGRVTGVDLSSQMMDALRLKIAGTRLRIDLARADAVCLPFPDESFELIYAAHVLHLVKGWREAVGEARRTVQSGGCFVVSWHRRIPDSPNVLLRKELQRLTEEWGINTRRPGAQSEEEILQALKTWGGEPQVVNVADWTEPCTPGQIIDELDRQIYSETWMIPREVMDVVIPPLRVWAAEKFGSLEQEIVSPYDFRWLVALKT